VRDPRGECAWSKREVNQVTQNDFFDVGLETRHAVLRYGHVDAGIVAADDCRMAIQHLTTKC
jgi:hypothetical protein